MPEDKEENTFDEIPDYDEDHEARNEFYKKHGITNMAELDDEGNCFISIIESNFNTTKFKITQFSLNYLPKIKKNYF